MGLEGPKAILYDTNDNPLVGQLAMAASLPVTVASDQSAFPILISGKSTYTVVAAAVALGNNKSLFSIAVTGSTYKVGLQKLYLRNVQTAAVTGVITTFELHRFTSHSAGTALTPVAYATADSLPADVTVKTGATIVGESANLMERWLWSSDEWGTGTLDQEGYDHAPQTLIAAIDAIKNGLPLYVPGGGGVTFKCVTNTTAGTFDIIAMFTVEAA